MAKRGPKPKPTALKILRGTRADRINKREPKRLEAVPECPRDLDRLGREEWRRMVKLLAGLGVLSTSDGPTLALYCAAYSSWRRARAVLEKRGGLTVKTAQGTPKVSPYVTIAAAAEWRMQRLLAEFGCSPSARSRLSTGEAARPASALAEWMNRARA